MRRISLAVLVLALVAVPAGLVSAQTQDPLITSARQFSQQGNHDTAIAMLRSGLASRPADEALKAALVDVLMLKRSELMRLMAEVNREINALRPPTLTGTVAVGASAGMAGVGGARSMAPVRVGGTIGVPMKIRDVKPAYPPDAQAARVTGIVLIEATIGTDGSVTDAKVLRGVPPLNDAALAAVRQWQYTPTLLNGVPVPVIMTVTVQFYLQ